MKKPLILLVLFFSAFQLSLSGSTTMRQSGEPLRVAVVGLTHSHVHWILGRPDKGDIKIVGIAEPNTDLAKRYSEQHGFSMGLVYASLEQMLDEVKPEAVTAFNSIYGHLEVVEACAPRGIHVMVEKPLAVSLKHARKMEKLARQYKIHLLTNYETTWYATNHKSYEMIHGEKAIGDIRKIVVHDGHEGPKEIRVNDEFLDWLTDPVLNGGGAITDFACYGANLVTWLMQGERPVSVLAVTQQIKPHIYPKVDDEATIIVTYPKAQGIIQASWNWPFSRKDMEVYGQTGLIISENQSKLRYRLNAKEEEKSVSLKSMAPPVNDPFAYLAAVVNGQIVPSPSDLSALENNMIVVEILEAAKKSAKKGKKVNLK